MNNGITFQNLLAQAGGSVKVDELTEKKVPLEKKKIQLEKHLEDVIKELREIDSQLNEPVKEAIKAARILNIEVPAEYAKTNTSSRSNNGNRGKLLWTVNGGIPFRGTVSDACWRAGDNGGSLKGGVLSTDEFWKKVKLEPQDMEVGKNYTLELKGDKKLTFQKVE